MGCSKCNFCATHGNAEPCPSPYCNKERCDPNEWPMTIPGGIWNYAKGRWDSNSKKFEKWHPEYRGKSLDLVCGKIPKNQV